MSAKKKARVPVWLNADVLQGPGGAEPTVDARDFVRLCTTVLPWAVLSLGWTTKLGMGSMLGRSLGYQEEHVSRVGVG